MDNTWERSIPFYDAEINEITNIFMQYDDELEVYDFSTINIGCRNSNYKINTNKGIFLLRICPVNDTSYRKDKIIGEKFTGCINIPRLYFVSENNTTQRVCLIYEYINGSSMQETVARTGKLGVDIIEKVAKCAASIHNSDIEKSEEFDNDYPPFSSWYNLFLQQDIVTERIGYVTKERVKKLIYGKQRDLDEIDRYRSFIHSDFRPANMLIDKNNDIWIVDWEFSGFGHSLADIGQFFRYSTCFEPDQIKSFETIYNSFSERNLPPNWYELSRLRDLVNPLQMLGGKENLPQKYTDLKNIILDTLIYFGY